MGSRKARQGRGYTRRQKQLLPCRNDEFCPVVVYREWRALLHAEDQEASEDNAPVFVALDNRCWMNRCAHKPIYAIRKQTQRKSVQMLERYIREVEVFVGNAAEL